MKPDAYTYSFVKDTISMCKIYITLKQMYMLPEKAYKNCHSILRLTMITTTYCLPLPMTHSGTSENESCVIISS